MFSDKPENCLWGDGVLVGNISNGIVVCRHLRYLLGVVSGPAATEVLALLGNLGKELFALVPNGSETTVAPDLFQMLHRDCFQVFLMFGLTHGQMIQQAMFYEKYGKHPKKKLDMEFSLC